MDLSGQSIVFHTNNEEKISDIEWSEHPKFKGVHMKHIITGASTEGLISCHLVRVMPGCCLEMHIHDNNLEMHEVMDGKGTCLLDGKEILYQKGVAAIIPKGSPHMVKAGDKGLMIMARFAPALV